jgi:nucleoside-diphosphate-sugar epimerase
LVTGATGFIGSHLTERLLSMGTRVRIMVRSAAKAAHLAALGAEVVHGDLTHPETLGPACAGCGIVYHCAAWLGSPYRQDIAWQVNVAGTAAMASASFAAHVERFVHLSSLAVYGPVRSGVVREESPLWQGVELYGDSKIAAEQVLQDAGTRGLSNVILRPGMVHGPRSRGWTLWFVDRIRKGYPVMLAGGFGLCRPVFIDNLVDAIVLAAVRPAGGHAFTIVDADIPWRDFVGFYGRMLKRQPRSAPRAIGYALAAADTLRAVLTGSAPRLRPVAVGYALSRARYSTEKAQRLLGWTPRTHLDDAMPVTEHWLRQQGYLPARETN